MLQSLATSLTTNASHGAECSSRQITFMCRGRWPHHLPQTLLMVQSAVPIKQRSCASIAGHITYHKRLSWCRVQFPSNNIHVPHSLVTLSTTNTSQMQSSSHNVHVPQSLVTLSTTNTSEMQNSSHDVHVPQSQVTSLTTNAFQVQVPSNNIHMPR